MYGRRMLFWVEMKKYIMMVPVILAETVLAGALLFGIGFCASKAVYGEKAVSEIRVGIVTHDDDRLTEMLIRFVASMDSIKDTVSFVRLSGEEAGKELSGGGLSAAVLVPEGIVNSVNSGENTPATILLAGGYSKAETEVFRQFADAGARLLTVAQAGIYAADAFCIEEGHPEKIPQAEDYLNRKYLDYAMGRSGFFKEVEVSAAPGMGMTEYYGISLLLAFFSFAGISFGKCMRIQAGEREKMLRARGIGAGERYLADAAAFGGVFALLGTVIGVLLYALLSGGFFAFRVKWLWMWLLWFSVGVFLRLMLQITGNHAGGISLCFGILIVLMLAAGIFIPAPFLPLWAEKAGNILPYKCWMEILAAILRGDFGRKAAAELLAMILLFVLAGVFAAVVREGKWQPGRNKGTGEKHERRMPNTRLSALLVETAQRGQMGAILWKQYFMKFRLWIVISLLASFFIGIAGGFGGKPSAGQEYRGIEVGICASDEKGREIISALSEEKGIFRFESYEDEEEMLRRIKNGSLECGYFMPEGFYEKLVAGKLKRQAVLYRSPGSSVHKISGEIVFAHLFTLLSEEVLEGYLRESGFGEGTGFGAGQPQENGSGKRGGFAEPDVPLAAEKFESAKRRLCELNDKYMGDGSTFHFLYERADSMGGEKPETLNTVRGIIAVMIFLTGLLGFGNVLDKNGIWSAMPGRMGRRMKAEGILIAAAGSVLLGGVCLWLTGNAGEAGKELVGLFVYFIALVVFFMILRLIIGNSRTLYGLLPILILGSCLFCPVFIKAERYLPQIAWISRVLPADWYLRLF